MLKKSRVIYLYFPLSIICFVSSWAVRMPKFSSWNDEQLLYFNFLVMHSLQLIFSKNWVRWSQKIYPEPEILWVVNAWSESKLLRNMIWWIRVATNLFWAKFYVRNFYLWKLQNKKFLDDEKYLPEPYAWSLQRNNISACCLCHFELCQILWPLWVSFHTLIIENHVHTTPTC